ncbi:MAG: DinB family protein, partial [Bacillota bacterium]|nr:DinB family protein [Bacillota bacterium]
IAAVVTHLLFWDRYSFSERFPFFQEGASLTPFPDFQKVNDEAANYAHSGISKNEIINELLIVREQYIKLLNELTEEQLEISFTIGSHLLTIRDYFKDFVEHDLHHKQQIEKALG